MSKQIVTMVLTGGPCAGKTTVLSRIQEELPKSGWHVLTIRETATDLIDSGITPWDAPKVLDFQRIQMHCQLEHERATKSYARTLVQDKILIVCDRGAMDTKAYLSSEDFATLLRECHTNEVELRDSYSFVIHLETAAKGAEEFYTLSNNSARTETIDEARAIDDKTIAAWTGHPHLRVIGNDCTFEEKVQRTIAEINSALGEPTPLEIERKFLIKMPDLDRLIRKYHAEPIDIIQTYLTSEQFGVETRVRQRGRNGQFVCFLTEKIPGPGFSRIERERQIDQREYLSFLMNADPVARPIHKTRYCFPYEHQYIELDVFPNWSDRALVEIELRTEHDPVVLPPEFALIREVTGLATYTNYAFAHQGFPS